MDSNLATGQPTPISEPSKLSDPERWVDDYGDYLFRYAWSRLRNETRAEDLVQETFLVALRSGSSFAGRSAEKSWLVGILRHKILDHFRRVGREESFTDLAFYSEEENEPFVAHGPLAGGWIHELGPLEWSTDPGASLDAEAFWKVFQNCASKLPVKVAAVFRLRELDDLDSKEICQTLNISESNLWVMLHRARMALRSCLETNWFGSHSPCAPSSRASK